MAYKLTYTWRLSWVGPGSGPMTGRDGVIPGGAGAQSLGGVASIGGQTVAGSGASGVLAAADITALTNGMATDVAAQMNATDFITRAGRWTIGHG